MDNHGDIFLNPNTMMDLKKTKDIGSLSEMKKGAQK
jgi:hypothetical protein